MGTSPSRLTEAHRVLVLDASVMINFLGSGDPEQLLRALSRRVLLVDIARGEIRRDPFTRDPADAKLRALVSSGLIEDVTLNASGYELFLQLTGAPSPDDLGDGESATIAFATQAAAVAVMDDRKGARIAMNRMVSGMLLHSMDLFCSKEVCGIIQAPRLADLVFSSLQTARMRVPHDFRQWVLSLLGSDRVKACPSIGLLDK